MTKAPIIAPFHTRDVATSVLAILLYALDYGSDIAVAYYLYDERGWWFAITVCLIVVPLFLVNLFSIFWHHQDHKSNTGRFLYASTSDYSDKERAMLLVTHVLFLGPIVRYRSRDVLISVISLTLGFPYFGQENVIPAIFPQYYP